MKTECKKLFAIFAIFILAFTAFGQNTDCAIKWQITPTLRYDGHTYYAFSAYSKLDTTGGVKYFWKFGDGFTSFDPSPIHTFKQAGNYVITMEIYTAKNEKCVVSLVDNFQGDAPTECSMLGTVVDYRQMDGCSYVIKADNGELIQPVIIDPNFVLRNGMRVKFSFTSVKMMTTCMSGIPASITCIKEFKPDSVIYPCAVDFKFHPSDSLVTSSDIVTYVFQPIVASKITQCIWDFGDGTTSTELTAKHTFKRSSNKYTVCFKATNDAGCINSICKDIFINPPPINTCLTMFKFQISPNIDPTIGMVPVTFFPVSNVKLVKTYWNFGDSATSYDFTPTHLFAINKGAFRVCLTTTDDLGCVSNYCLPVNFNTNPAPTCAANFKFAPETAAPLSLAFQDVSAGNVVAWNWDFNDGTTSNLQNPKHVFINTPIDSLRMNPIGSTSPVVIRVVCLTIKTADGCSSKICLPVMNNVPTPPLCFAKFRVEKLVNTTATQLSFKFNNASTTTANQWFWNFGDNTNSNDANPSHTYTSPGQYVVSLTVLTTDNCKAFYTEILNVGGNVVPNQCVAKFFAEKDPTISSSQFAYRFFNKSNVQNGMVFWEFGDNTTSYEANPLHKFAVAGQYKVSLTILTADSCKSTYSELVNVSATVPPTQCFSDFDFVRDLVSSTGQFTYSFISKATAVTAQWYWDFGDNTISNEQNPRHYYKSAGTYNVSLTIITPDNCKAISHKTIVVTNDLPICNNSINFAILSTSTSAICNGSVIANLTDYNGNPIPAIQYLWSNGATTQALDNICSNTQYKLSVTDGKGCKTNSSFILVDAKNWVGNSDWNWYWMQNGGNLGFKFELPATLDSLKNLRFEWNLGDGTILEGKKVEHVYTKSGDYVVNMKVTDNLGNVVYNQSVTLNAQAKASLVETGISEVNQASNIKLYPNPVVDELTIQMNIAQKANVKLLIVNSMGQTQRSINYVKEEGVDFTNVNVSNLSAGVYFVRVQFENSKPINLKFVK